MKNKIVFPLLFIVSILSGCNSHVTQNLSISDFQKTYKVDKGVIKTDNSYVWSLQSQNTTFLWFKLPWKITNIYVKEGDVVKRWQLLATLDGNEIKTKYRSAKQMLSSLWVLYNNTAKMFDAKIQSTKAKIAQVQAWMDWVKIGVGDTNKINTEQLATIQKKVNQSKIELSTIKSKIDNTNLVLKQKEQNIYSNSKNAISQSNILLENFLIFTDQLFWISDTNKHKNDAFESYLSAKNTSLKDSIKTDWLKLNNKYQTWNKDTNTLLNDIKSSNSVVNDQKLKQRIYENLNQTKDLLVLSRNLASKVFAAVDSSVVSRSFSQKMINQYKKQTSTYQHNIESALLTTKWNFIMWIKWSIQNIENFKKQYSMQLDLLQKKYELTQASYETVKQTYKQYEAISKWKVNKVNTKFDVIKEQYNEAVNWLQALKEQKQTQLSQIKSQIDQVKWNRNLAAVNLWNIKLYSPYAGVITKKIGDIWQVVWAGMPILKIANYKQLKWIFYIPIEEIKNIKVWNEMIIKWLWQTTSWKISVIYPTINSISKKLQIDVKLNKFPKDWVLWMYITWYPLSIEYTWIVIPYDSITYKYWKTYVLVKNNNKFEEKNITLWKCNTNICIVKKWLKIWNIIKQ